MKCVKKYLIVIIRKGSNAENGDIVVALVEDYEETSKYPEEKKSTEIPKVAASEIGLALKLYRR